jgi:hypothetical protein
MRKRRLVAGLYFIEFLRTDRLLVVEILVTLQCRLSQSQVRIGRGNFLPGSTLGRRCTVDRSPRLGIIDNRKHLPTPHAIPFMSAELDDVPHHLAGELAGFGRANRSHRFQQIGYVGPLYREHGDIAHSFWRRRRYGSLTGTTGQASGQSDRQRNET